MNSLKKEEERKIVWNFIIVSLAYQHHPTCSRQHSLLRRNVCRQQTREMKTRWHEEKIEIIL